MLHNRQTIVAALILWAASSSAIAQPVILRNEHLTVTFTEPPAGPHLASIRHHATDEIYEFARAEEVAMAIVRLENVHDPAYRTRYEFGDAFAFQRIAVDESRRQATLTFTHELIDAKIRYELAGDVLRKTVACTAKGAGAYVAGVTLWLLKPVELPLAWPKSDSVGRPALLFGKKSGCFLTLGAEKGSELFVLAQFATNSSDPFCAFSRQAKRNPPHSARPTDAPRHAVGRPLGADSGILPPRGPQVCPVAQEVARSGVGERLAPIPAVHQERPAMGRQFPQGRLLRDQVLLPPHLPAGLAHTHQAPCPQAAQVAYRVDDSRSRSTHGRESPSASRL